MRLNSESHTRFIRGDGYGGAVKGREETSQPRNPDPKHARGVCRDPRARKTPRTSSTSPLLR